MIKDCNLKTAENRHFSQVGRENRAQLRQMLRCMAGKPSDASYRAGEVGNA